MRLNKITLTRVLYNTLKTKNDLENLYTAAQNTITSLFFNLNWSLDCNWRIFSYELECFQSVLSRY
jgi:hypothetical protein